jgi:hypothetical protein
MATTTSEAEEGRLVAVPALATGPAGKTARRLPKLPWFVSRLCFVAAFLLLLHVVFPGPPAG